MERDKSIKLNQSNDSYYTFQNDVIINVSKNVKNGIFLEFKDFRIEMKPITSLEIISSASLQEEKNLMVVSGYELYMKESSPGSGIELYAVMRGAQDKNCPLYCIIEHSFHTNANAANWLLSDQNLRELAKTEAKIIANNYRN